MNTQCQIVCCFLATLMTFALANEVDAQGSKKTLEQQAAQFENRICGVNPNRTLFRNMQNQETVLFFQNHTPRNQMPLNDVMSNLKSKAARVAHLKMFIDSNYAIVKKMEEVLNTIGDRLIAKKISWLGIEKSPDEIGPEIEAELFKVAAELEQRLTKDKIKISDIKTFFLLQMGPVLYARWKNSQLKNTTALVALDDLTIRLKTHAYRETVEKKAIPLLQAVPGSGIRTSEMEQIIDLSQIALFSGVKEKTPEFVALVAKIKNPTVQKAVAEYRKWIEQGIDSLAERDDAVAKAILSQKGMGLILLSANFGPGVSDRLMDACPNSSKKTSP